MTEERWNHIIEEHAELSALQQEILQAVAEPDRVLAGGEEELLAVRMLLSGKWLIVVYREVTKEDGFIITAFLTRKSRSLDRRLQLWP